jgi:hypothetical protein
MAKYFSDYAGIMTEVTAITSSAGAGDAGKIIGLDSSGLIDISFMPVGVGAEVTVAPSSENLTAGNFVNLFNNTVINVRKADATTATKPAHGFVLANVTSPANATVYGISNKNTAQSGMTIGARQYLSTTAGNATDTAAAGNIVQYLGIAQTAAAIVFSNEEYWVKS